MEPTPASCLTEGPPEGPIGARTSSSLYHKLMAKMANYRNYRRILKTFENFPVCRLVIVLISRSCFQRPAKFKLIIERGALD